MTVASVVIPAHNEAAVVGRCLRALLADAAPEDFEVVVVANGCSDETAAAARRAAEELGPAGSAVTVLDRREPGKIGALNAGDAVATAFPRIYLDADAVLTAEAARATAAVLAGPPATTGTSAQAGTGEPAPPLAAAPRPAVDVTDCSPLVRWHYQAWERLPVTGDGYVGSGVYGLSRAGHARVAPFPEVIADDHYVRRAFAHGERATADAEFTIYPPRTVAAHLHRASRAHRGNTTLDRPGSEITGRGAALHPDAEHGPRGVRGLVVVAGDPRNWHRVAAFLLLTTLTRWRAHRQRHSPSSWNRDSTSRVLSPGSAA